MNPGPNLNFRELEADLAAHETPGSPTAYEAARLLHDAFTLLEAAVSAGMRERNARRALWVWMAAHRPWMPRMPRTLQRQVERDLSDWRAGGRTPAALMDRRGEANKKRRKFPTKLEVDRVVAVAISRRLPAETAWRELLWEQGLEAKGEMPRYLRRAVVPLVRTLQPLADSPRKARINGAHNTLDWSEVHAGDIFSADDFTLEVYFYRPDGRLTRGQWLMMVDARSKRILEAILVPEKSYTAVDIRRLILRTADRYGLPRRHFLFENGIWRRSSMIGGTVPTGQGRIENFAQRLGVEIRHAARGNPRGKAFLENAGKLFQARLRDLPGWCGPNEQLSAVEAVQRAKLDVSSGRMSAAEAGFQSFEVFAQELDRAVDEYNATPQESSVMGGNRIVKMSPNDAWQELQQRNIDGVAVPGVSLTGALRHLLSSHIQLRKVTRNGIRIVQAGEQFWFREGLADFVNRELLTYWDVEHPELLTCENEDGRTFIVTREPLVSAVASAEELTEAIERRNGFTKRFSGRLAEIQALPVGKPRKVIASAAEIAKGRLIHEQQATAIQDARAADSLSRRLGVRIDPAIVQRNRQGFEQLAQWKAEQQSREGA